MRSISVTSNRIWIIERGEPALNELSEFRNLMRMIYEWESEPRLKDKEIKRIFVPKYTFLKLQNEISHEMTRFEKRIRTAKTAEDLEYFCEMHHELCDFTKLIKWWDKLFIEFSSSM